jgi:hypothetical protein
MMSKLIILKPLGYQKWKYNIHIRTKIVKFLLIYFSWGEITEIFRYARLMYSSVLLQISMKSRKATNTIFLFI